MAKTPQTILKGNPPTSIYQPDIDDLQEWMEATDALTVQVPTVVADAAAEADRAEAAADVAGAFAAADKRYSDTTLAAAVTAALADTVDGDDFVATGEDVDFCALYANDGGSAVEYEGVRLPKQSAVEAINNRTKISASPSSVPSSPPYTSRLDPSWMPKSLVGTQFALADQPLLSDFDRMINFRRGAYVQLSEGTPTPESYFGAMSGALGEPDGILTIDPETSANVSVVGLNTSRTDVFTSIPADVTVNVVDVADLPEDIRDAFGGLTLDGQPIYRVFHITSSTTTTLTDWGEIGVTSNATVSAYVWAVSGNIQVSRQNRSPFSSVATTGQLERISTSATGSASDKARIRMTSGSEFYVTGLMLNAGSLTDYVVSEKSKWSLLVNEDSLGSGMLRMTVRFPTEGTSEYDYLFCADNKDEASPPRLLLWMDWTTGNIRFEGNQAGPGPNLVTVPSAWSPDQPITIAASWEAGGRVGLSVNGASPVYEGSNSPNLTTMRRLILGAAMDPASAEPTYSSLTDGLEIWDFAYKEGFA